MKDKHNISHELITALSLIAATYFCPNGNHLCLIDYNSELECFNIAQIKDGESIYLDNYALSEDELRIICKAMRRNYAAYSNTVMEWEHIYNKVIHFFES